MADEMIKVSMPTEEWTKMERNHGLIEDFEINANEYDFEEALAILAEKIKNLLKEDN